jgi:hypothetical protein
VPHPDLTRPPHPTATRACKHLRSIHRFSNHVSSRKSISPSIIFCENGCAGNSRVSKSYQALHSVPSMPRKSNCLWRFLKLDTSTYCIPPPPRIVQCYLTSQRVTVVSIMLHGAPQPCYYMNEICICRHSWDTFVELYRP